ncbi:MAG: glycosyltransferase family 4 protein [Actinobacteria bacterium]|nr:glycosyltransferase family 4 protein [Actinomycetota bacterium]
MNICHIASTFLPVVGGAELAVHYIAKYQAYDNRVLVIAPRDKTGSEFETNYSLIRFPIPNNPQLFEVVLSKLIYRYASSFNANIIHAHMAYPAGYLSTYASRKLKIPMIVTPQGADVQVNPEINYGLALNKRLAKKINFALQSADAIGSISRSIKNTLLNMGVAENKIHEIPNGVDVNSFEKNFSDGDLREVIDEYGLSKFDKIIISVGRNHPKKGFNVLIEAVAKLLRSGLNVGCIIVGKDTEKLYPQVQSLGITGNIILTGQIPAVRGKRFSLDSIPDPKLLKLFKLSDIFVLPSLIEGFSLVVLEAMAAGLSIIVSDVEGCRDVVEDRVSGMLVKPGNANDLADKIKLLISNENLADRLIKGSILKVKGYDWESISCEYVKLYEDLT